MKKVISLILMLAIVCSSFTCFASNSTPIEVEEEQYLGKILIDEEPEEYLGNIEDMTFEEASPAATRAAISFGGAISVGATLRSSGTHYMQSGEGYSYSVTWAPTGQSVKVVRINVDTGSVYGTAAKTGGAASGVVGGSSVPAGEYRFGVYNAGTKKITSCTCSINL